MTAPVSRRPNPRIAMRTLIGQIRAALPLESPAARVCVGDCQGCSLKLLELLDSELRHWEGQLESGSVPRLGDLNRLAKLAMTTRAVLERNGVLPT